LSPATLVSAHRLAVGLSAWWRLTVSGWRSQRASPLIRTGSGMPWGSVAGHSFASSGLGGVFRPQLDGLTQIIGLAHEMWGATSFDERASRL
jgi:hypothetical protein